MNNEVAAGSINVKDLVLRAGPPLEDHLGDISSVESAALITATGYNNLTIEPGEVDYFEYQATDYVSA